MKMIIKSPSSDSKEEFTTPVTSPSTAIIASTSAHRSAAELTKQLESLNVQSQKAGVTTSLTRSCPSPLSVRLYTQSPEVEHIITIQMSRLNLIQSIKDEVEQLTFNDITPPRVNSRKHSLDDLWNCFSQDHKKLGEKCSSTFYKHPYIKSQTFENTYKMYTLALDKLNDLQYSMTLKGTFEDPTLSTANSSSQSSTDHLPKIFVRSFDGHYKNWSQFKDQFSSLIINNSEVSDVERMHYLKSCVKGDAGKLIENLPIKEDTFITAWSTLIQRFEVRRLLISVEINKLLSLSQCSRDSQSLNQLNTAITQSLDALKLMGCPVEHWDQLLVYLLTNKLDSKTRYDWEMQLGSSNDFPTLDQLKKLITDHSRALERGESTKPTKARKTRKCTAQTINRAHAATTHQPKTSTAQPPIQYPCDQCRGQHYVVACPKFRELTPRQRLISVKELNLCFNCLGHHSLSNCKSSKRCNICSSLHHTMLHSTDAPPGTQTSTATGSSTTS